MEKGITVVKHAGQLPPDSLLAKLIDGQTVISVAALLAGASALTISRRRMQMNLDQARVFYTKSQDKQMVAYHQHGAVALDEDMEPFVLIENDKKEPLVVCFLDGDFSMFEQQDSTHTNEFHAVNVDLRPRIQKLYNLVGKDITKLFAELNDPITSHDIGNNMVGERGSITFAAVGADNKLQVAHVVVAEDKTQQSYDWGWTSDTMGFQGEAPKAAPVDDDPFFGDVPQEGPKSPSETVVQPAAPGPAESAIPSRPKRTAASVPAIPGSGPQPDVGPAKDTPGTQQPGPGPGEPQPSVEPHPATPNPDEVLSLIIPESIRRGDRRAFAKYVRKRVPGGLLPSDYLALTEIRCLRKDATRLFMDDYNKGRGIEAVRESLKSTTSTALPPSATSSKSSDVAAAKTNGTRPPLASIEPIKQPVKTEPQKDTAAHHVTADKPASKGVLEGKLPLIPPEERRTLLQILENPDVKKAVGAHSQVMNSPKEFGVWEEKLPKIHQQLGLKSIDEVANIDIELWYSIIAASKHAGVAAIVSFIAEYKHMDNYAAELIKEIDGLKKQIAGTSEEPVKEQEEVPLKATGTDGPSVTRKPIVRDDRGELISDAVPARPRRKRA